LTIEEIFGKVTSFNQKQSNLKKEENFFEVTLHGVKSFRNYIFDIQKIKYYLCQVAPLPFDPEKFRYGKEITNYLLKNVNQYGEYDIRLNGTPIYRPYIDEIKVTSKKTSDPLIGVEFFQIELGGEPAAYGWYGKRKELLGAISKGTGTSGIRVKTGNIMIGDQHLLDKSFREDRFNSYLIGEIHVNSPYLVPNSRRDDFVDNEKKNLFYNHIEKVVGLPLSKEIRLRSRINASSNTAQEGSKQVLEKEPKSANSENMKPCKNYCESQTFTKEDTENLIMQTILKECKQCPKLGLILGITQDKEVQEGKLKIGSY
jgi:hypothetical protein